MDIDIPVVFKKFKNLFLLAQGLPTGGIPFRGGIFVLLGDWMKWLNYENHVFIKII